MIHIPIHILKSIYIFETTNRNVCWAYHFYAFKFASNQPSKNSWPAQPLVLLAVGPDAALGNTWKPIGSRSVFAMRSTVHKHLKQSVVSFAFIYLLCWCLNIFEMFKVSQEPVSVSTMFWNPSIANRCENNQSFATGTGGGVTGAATFGYRESPLHHLNDDIWAIWIYMIEDLAYMQHHSELSK